MDRFCLAEKREQQYEGTKKTKRAVVEFVILWSPASDAPAYHRSLTCQVFAPQASLTSTEYRLFQLESPVTVLEWPSGAVLGSSGEHKACMGTVGS